MSFINIKIKSNYILGLPFKNYSTYSWISTTEETRSRFAHWISKEVGDINLSTQVIYFPPWVSDVLTSTALVQVTKKSSPNPPDDATSESWIYVSVNCRPVLYFWQLLWRQQMFYGWYFAVEMGLCCACCFIVIVGGIVYGVAPVLLLSGMCEGQYHVGIDSLLMCKRQQIGTLVT